MPYYFAYGSCMNAEDLKRTVKANEVGVAQLYGYKLAFSRYSATRRGGVADIVLSESDYVEGILMEVPDFVGLDAREGHPYVYKRTLIEVYIPNTKEWVHAYTYEVVNKEAYEVKPSKEYAMLIWEGAKRLSKDYRKILKANILKERKRYYAPARVAVNKRASIVPISNYSSKGKKETKRVGVKTGRVKTYTAETLPFDYQEYLASRYDVWMYE